MWAERLNRRIEDIFKRPTNNSNFQQYASNSKARNLHRDRDESVRCAKSNKGNMNHIMCEWRSQRGGNADENGQSIQSSLNKKLYSANSPLRLWKFMWLYYGVGIGFLGIKRHTRCVGASVFCPLALWESICIFVRLMTCLRAKLILCTTGWSGPLWKQINIIKNKLQLSRLVCRRGLVWNLECVMNQHSTLNRQLFFVSVLQRDHGIPLDVRCLK